MVSVPLEQLQLLDGQDMALVSREELLAGSIWTTQLGTHPPLADERLEVCSRCSQTRPEHNKARSVGPGRLPTQPWSLPKGVGRSCAVV